MFKVTGLIDVAPQTPSVLIPIFSQSASNEPFMQTMDEYYYVTRFTPFFKLEEYPICVPDQQYSTDIGQLGLIAFRSTDRTIWCGNVADVISCMKNMGGKIPGAPLLTLQLTRIITRDTGELYPLWQDTRNAFILNTNNQRDWVRYEHLLHDANEKIWSQIRKQSPKAKNTFKIDFDMKISFDPELLLSCLASSESYHASNWTSLWFELVKAMPEDERVFDLAHLWL